MKNPLRAACQVCTPLLPSALLHCFLARSIQRDFEAFLAVLWLEALGQHCPPTVAL